MDPISYYRCDNVAISDLQMRGDLLPNGDDKTRYKYDFNVPASSIVAEPATRMRITVSTKLD